jgi:D-alanyl-D-alanine dipeptidase
MKPYQTIPIAECGEKLVPIPSGTVLLTNPHPYAALGAPYGGADPWLLREGVLAALLAAQKELTARRPDLLFQVFDAYRPNAVQQFMVEREFSLVSGGRSAAQVAEPERAQLYEKTFRIWAIPSESPITPPPHSTGAAIDLTLVDKSGQSVVMGSPIDENSDRSNPDYFKTLDPAAHANRAILHDVMRQQGFQRHPAEWWHFSLGDQMWALAERQANPLVQIIARYGRASLLPR